MRTTSYSVILLFFLAACLAGCGKSEEGPTLYPVEGEVTFDGEPVEEGRILFRKADGDQRAFSGVIQNGQYELNAEAGSMIVEIEASRIIPGKFDTSNGTPEPVGEMYIPTKYNSQTTLTAEVKEDEENQIPFTMTSK